MVARDVGYSHVRILNSIYKVIGYGMKTKTVRGRKTWVEDKSIVQFKKIKELRAGSWIDVQSDPITRRKDADWRIWHDHSFIKGNLEQCMSNSGTTTGG